MRVISENIANAELDRAARRAASPTGARSRPSAAEVDRALDVQTVGMGARAARTRAISAASTSRGIRPPTDNGYVKYPNVNSLVEMTDMREAQRSYEANLNVIGATRRMIQRTIELLKRLISTTGSDTWLRRSPPRTPTQSLRGLPIRAPIRCKGSTGDSAGPNFGAMVKEAIGAVVEAGRSPTRRRKRWWPARRTSSMWSRR